ncbi:MAG TPA: putative collagen-binding domain-containing protein, partial [Solirubrobacteraceae bacterium]|nr:putative collagen-binding domain-containing protein [Solirubrobacteraceae bacterium]
QNHALVTAGFGTFASTGSIDANNYVSAAATPDGKLALAYLPKGGTITVALSQMLAGGSTVARWYDPSNGSFTSISGSPFADTGSQKFTTPGNNSDGNSDWVLLLQASSAAPPSSPAPVGPTNTKAPTIGGTPQQGDTLTASQGTWTGDTPMTFAYLWSDGTTGSTDTLGASDVGQNITVRVTATNDGGNASATSSSVGPVTASTPPSSSPTGAANLWISPSGGSCTRQSTAGAEVPSQDCGDMGTAYSKAQCGDVVNVDAGDYATEQILKENTALDNCSSPVVFQAAPGFDRSQVIMGDVDGNSIDSGDFGPTANWWEVKDMTIPGRIVADNCEFNTNGCSNPSHNVTVDNVKAGTVWGFVNNLTVENSNFGPCYNLGSGFSDQGNNGDKLVSPDPSVRCDDNFKCCGAHSVVKNNVIHDFLDDNSDPATDHFECMFVGSAVDVTIEDNKFYNCQIYDIFIQNAGAGPLVIQDNWFGPGLGGMGSCTADRQCPSPTGGGANNWNVTDGDNSGSPPTTNVLIRYNSFDPAAGFSNQSNASANSGPTWRFVGNIMGQGGCQSQFTYSDNLWQSGGPCGTGDVTTTTNPFVLSGQKDSLDDLHVKCGSAAANIVPSGSGDSALSTDIDGLARTWPSDAGASVESSCGT